MIYVYLTLMMFDYLLTYIGIKLYVIYEGNILMLWLFEYNLFYGLILRLMTGLILLSIIYYLKGKTKAYGYVLGFAILSNLAVLGLHLRWIATL